MYSLISWLVVSVSKSSAMSASVILVAAAIISSFVGRLLPIQFIPLSLCFILLATLWSSSKRKSICLIIVLFSSLSAPSSSSMNKFHSWAMES